VPKQAPAVISSRLVTALSHPTRVHAMTVLNERQATPGEIAASLGEPVNNVTYHINVLLELGCIELVDVKPAHGGRVVEHFYRATHPAYIDLDGWEKLGENEKFGLVAALMRLVSDDIDEAMSQGTFYEPDDNHLSRSPMVVDPEGWGETRLLLEETVFRLMDIQENVKVRAGDKGAEAMHIKVEMLQFRSPSPKGS
jgi:DNA-binding transcriptional ArsR family regulator